jgi:hypothetical protein
MSAGRRLGALARVVEVRERLCLLQIRVVKPLLRVLRMQSVQTAELESDHEQPHQFVETGRNRL